MTILDVIHSSRGTLLLVRGTDPDLNGLLPGMTVQQGDNSWEIAKLGTWSPVGHTSVLIKPGSPTTPQRGEITVVR